MGGGIGGGGGGIEGDDCNGTWVRLGSIRNTLMFEETVTSALL